MSDETEDKPTNTMSEQPADDLQNEPGSDQSPGHARPRGGALTAGLALILSLIACAGVGYLWWSGQQQVAESPETVDYSARIDARIATAAGAMREELVGSIAPLEQRIAQSEQSMQQRLVADSASLGASLARLQADLRSNRTGLERRLEMTESSIAKLAEMRLDSARSLGLAEAEYLLRLANERLDLFEDPAGALKALKLAAAQLRALGDPVFNSVRQALAIEIQSLEAVELPDRVTISGRLLALTRGAAQWPLDSRRSLGTQGHNVLEPAGDEAGWWARFKSVLSSAVTVHREQSTATVLLSLEEERLLRENLRLQLQIAQLAAVRAEPVLYHDAIALVAEWLRQYYDREAATVGEALQVLLELGQIELDPDLPEITTALRLLRNLQIADELDLEPDFAPAPEARRETGDEARDETP